MAKYKKRADGYYRISVDIGYDEDGKRIRQDIRAKTIKDLEHLIAEAKRSKQKGYIPPKDLTVEDYARRFLNTYKITKEENTKVMYENSLRAHIAPTIGFIKMKHLSATDVQQLINSRADRRRTCEIILMFIGQLVERARKDGVTEIDATDGVELPPDTKQSTKRPLTDLEKEALVSATMPLRNKAFVYILYGCGVRREEALGLRMRDIDIKAELLHVRQVVVFPDNNGIIKNVPKTEAGFRSVNIPSAILPTIRKYIASLSTIDPDALLFADKRGNPISKSMYRVMWKNIIKAMNSAVATEEDAEPIQGLTAHIFRHNYATLLFYSGVSVKKAAQLMGHANINMIMRIYAHLDEQKENAVEKINLAVKLG